MDVLIEDYEANISGGSLQTHEQNALATALAGAREKKKRLRAL